MRNPLLMMAILASMPEDVPRVEDLEPRNPPPPPPAVSPSTPEVFDAPKRSWVERELEELQAAMQRGAHPTRRRASPSKKRARKRQRDARRRNRKR